MSMNPVPGLLVRPLVGVDGAVEDVEVAAGDEHGEVARPLRSMPQKKNL